MAAIIAILVIVLIIVFPVKIAAGWVGAGRTGFGSCLVAVIVAGIFQAILQSFLGDQWVAALLVSLLGTPLAYMFVLDTTYVKGLVISIIQMLLLLLGMFILAALGLGVMSTLGQGNSLPVNV